MKQVGYDMTRKASTDAYAQAGITPTDIQVSWLLKADM